MPVTAASRGVPVPLFNNVTTGTSIPVAIPITSKNLRFHFRSNGTAASGTVVIEEALDPLTQQAWSTVQTVSLPTIGTDSEQVVHIAGTFSTIRLRFSVVWSGGGGLFASLVSD